MRWWRTGSGTPRPAAWGGSPLAHIDPIGLLMLLVFRFGWAKPVPVNPYYFPDRRKGMLYVAIAGPLTNVALAFLALVLLHAGAGYGLSGALLRGVYEYNVVLAVFNILPVPPLDGSRVLAGLLPPPQAARLEQMEAYGWLLLIVLLVTGVIERVMSPLVWGLRSLLAVAARPLGL